MNNISNFLVKTDHYCDYIPVISFITNLVDLFQKTVVLPFMDKKTISSNHYYKHINEKSFARCFLVLVPVIGNIIIRIYDFSKKKQNGNGVNNFKKEQGNVDKVTVKNQINHRPQDDSLEEINKMDQKRLNNLCQNIKVNDRNDYIKCMLIFAIKAKKFGEGNADMEFHNMIQHFQTSDGKLQEFVHEDIAAGRNNQDNTLLHEILKCKFLSAKTKGSAFDFILRDGHDYLRDYFGNRKLEKKNQWGNQPTTFELVKWGDSLKNLFDKLSNKEQEEFFENISQFTADHLNLFTGIKQIKL